ncbi:MAG TPA: hypothetical protein PL052_07105 [Synergistales bacterium]|nr:hypothetical protein [Synergistales bacterium]
MDRAVEMSAEHLFRCASCGERFTSGCRPSRCPNCGTRVFIHESGPPLGKGSRGCSGSCQGCTGCRH